MEAVARRALGELFIERGILDERLVEETLSEQRQTGLRFGEILLRKGLVTRPQLAIALSDQVTRATPDAFRPDEWRRRQLARGGPAADGGEVVPLAPVADGAVPLRGARAAWVPVDARSDGEEAETDGRSSRAGIVSEVEAELTARVEELARQVRDERDARAVLEAELDAALAELDRRRAEAAALRMRLEQLASEKAAAQLRAAETAAAAGRAPGLRDRPAPVTARSAGPAAGAPQYGAAEVPGPVTRIFVPREGGYETVTTRRGPFRPGAEILIRGVPYRVVRSGPSPLPGDVGPCSFVEPA